MDKVKLLTLFHRVVLVLEIVHATLSFLDSRFHELLDVPYDSFRPGLG